MNNDVNAALNAEDWFFSLSKTVVPSYQSGVADRHQPRAARAHRREQKRKLDPCPWQHIWLPHAARYNAEEHSLSSDSEDDTPKRGRLLGLPVKPSPTDGDELQRPSAALIEQHKAAEKDFPGISPHSCHHCRKVAVDLRRQHAYEILAADEQRPKGWRVQPTESGFTFGAARAAAADGCAFFSFVVGTLQVRGSSTVIDDTYEITITATMQGGASAGFSIQVRDHSGGSIQHRYNPTQSLDLYTVPGTRPLHNFLGYHLPPNLLPDSHLSFTRARDWLEKCDGNHSGCKALRPSYPYMPKRVLEVISSVSGDGLPLRTRLVTNAHLAPYVALSYCWGGDQMSKTVKAQVAAYERDIPLDTLPQTIQDALTVTHGIGLRYLWVDAMCIIQDDDQDKEEQIGQMYAVYRSAYVTISAATAASSREGFLQPRTQFRGFRLATRLDDNVFGLVIAVPEPKWFSHAGRDHEYPLFTRGWTYQEHQLSPRILVYGLCEVVYWCNESSHRDGGHERPYWQDHNQYASRIFYLGQLGSGELPQTTTHPAEWADVIENYSSRALTVEDDKLPAVAAVAERYAEITPVTDYLAGLWREDFLLQCLWRVWDPKKTTHPQNYQAPSWSWASVNGAIYPWVPPADSHEHASCELLAVETTLCSTRIRFGGVKAGFARVRARMRRVLWFNYDEYRGGRYQALNLCHGRDPEASDDELALLTQWNGADPRLTIMIDVAREWQAGSEVELWTLEVCAGEGILLQEVGAGGGDLFRRVGRISVQSQEYMAEPDWFNNRDSTWRGVTVV